MKKLTIRMSDESHEKLELIASTLGGVSLNSAILLLVQGYLGSDFRFQYLQKKGVVR